MSREVQLMLLLGLLPLDQVICYYGPSFVMVSEMKNIRFDEWIINSMSARGRLDCSMKCETHCACLSFQYSSLSGNCRLFNTVFLYQDSGMHDSGWNYYIASNRRCRESFVDGRDLDICFMFAGFHNVTDGMEECAAIQSSIIAITSAEENEFMLRLSGIFTTLPLPDSSFRRPFIQGFLDGADWILDNGSPLVYTNWYKGEPKIFKSKQYIKFTDGEWKTSVASNIRPVFCSYKL